jgi:DNA methyltransferase 1-associated protein 1
MHIVCLFQAWSREETDKLFELCERFDLRFIVIADRFPTTRSVEDLKNRYYSGNSILTSQMQSAM